MSYSVYLAIKPEGIDDLVSVQYLSNITWNVRELIKQSSGWEIKNEDDNGNVVPWLKQIIHGLSELKSNPKKYKKYESTNGWGTIDGTIRFYEECIKEAQNYMEWNENLTSVLKVYVC